MGLQINKGTCSHYLSSPRLVSHSTSRGVHLQRLPRLVDHPTSRVQDLGTNLQVVGPPTSRVNDLQGLPRPPTIRESTYNSQVELVDDVQRLFQVCRVVTPGLQIVDQVTICKSPLGDSYTAKKADHDSPLQLVEGVTNLRPFSKAIRPIFPKGVFVFSSRFNY